MTMNSPGNKGDSNRFLPLSDGSTSLVSGEGGTDGKETVTNGHGASYLPASTTPMTVDNSTGEDVDENGKTIKWDGVQIDGKMQPMDKSIEEAKQRLSKARADLNKVKKAAATKNATTAMVPEPMETGKPKSSLKQTITATKEKIMGIASSMTGGGKVPTAPPAQPTTTAAATTDMEVDTTVLPPPTLLTGAKSWYDECEEKSVDGDGETQASATTGDETSKPAARPSTDRQATAANDKPLYDVDIMAEFVVPNPDKSKKNPVAFPYIAKAHRMLDVLFQQEPYTKMKSVDGTKTVRSVEEVPMEQEAFDAFFGTKTVHNKLGGGKVCLQFTLVTTLTLGRIKKEGTPLRKLLNTTKTFLRSHKHKSHIIVRFAFVVGKHAKRTDTQLYEKEIWGVLQQHIIDNDLRDEDGNLLKVPTYDVIANTKVLHVKTAEDGTNHPTSCEALEFRCEKHRVKLLRKLIMDAKPLASRFGIIVPYDTKHDNEELFIHMIQEQAASQKEMMVVVTRGIRREVVDALIEVEGENKSVRHAVLDATKTIHNNSGIEIIVNPVLGFERTSHVGVWAMITTKRLENKANEVFDEIVRGKGCFTEEFITLHCTDDYGIRRDNDESNPLSIQDRNRRDDYRLDAQVFLANQMAMRADDMPSSPPRATGGSKGFKLVVSKKDFPHLAAKAQTNQETTNGQGPNPDTAATTNASVATPRNATNDEEEEDDEIATVNEWTNRVVATPPRASRSPTDLSTATSLAETVSTLFTKFTEDNNARWEASRREAERRDERLMQVIMAQQQQCNNMMAMFMAHHGMQSTMEQMQLPLVTQTQQPSPNGTTSPSEEAAASSVSPNSTPNIEPTTGKQPGGQHNAPTDARTLQQQLEYTASTISQTSAMQTGEAQKRKEVADVSYPSLFPSQQNAGLRQRRGQEKSGDQSANATTGPDQSGGEKGLSDSMTLDLSTICSVDDLVPSLISTRNASTTNQKMTARDAGSTNRHQKSSLQEAALRQDAEGPRKDE